MVDAMAPALDAYDAAVGDGIGPALSAAADAAATGRDRVDAPRGAEGPRQLPR